MSTTAQLSENSHQGFEAVKRMLCLASMQVKSNTASGMPVCLRRNGIGSRSSSKERDAETGLDFFLARYYSGAQGRFLSPDEFKGGIVDPYTGKQISQPGPLPYADIWDPQTLNKYGYVRNNPLRYVDPDGHDFWDFVNGAANAFSTDFFGGMGRQDSGNSDYSSGQGFGDAAAIVVGGIETIIGGGGEVGGLALNATGVGAFVGVPAQVVSTAAIVQGTTAVGTGAAHLMKATDLNRMEKGKPPIGGDGKPVELHHPEGNPKAQVQEMTQTEHRGAGNYSKNHPEGNRQPSRIDRNEAARQRRQHWKKRVEEIKEQGQD
jgi:RHS repeat-associated protein